MTKGEYVLLVLAALLNVAGVLSLGCAVYIIDAGMVPYSVPAGNGFAHYGSRENMLGLTFGIALAALLIDAIVLVLSAIMRKDGTPRWQRDPSEPGHGFRPVFPDVPGVIQNWE